MVLLLLLLRRRRLLLLLLVVLVVVLVVVVVRHFLAGHGSSCQCLSCPGPKSGGSSLPVTDIGQLPGVRVVG